MHALDFVQHHASTSLLKRSAKSHNFETVRPLRFLDKILHLIKHIVPLKVHALDL
jgi:hypothetical protein